MLSNTVFKYMSHPPPPTDFIAGPDALASWGFRLLKALATLFVRDHEVVAIMPMKNGTEVVVSDEAFIRDKVYTE